MKLPKWLRKIIAYGSTNLGFEASEEDVASALSDKTIADFDGDSVNSILNGVVNAWNRATGAHLTDADIEGADLTHRYELENMKAEQEFKEYFYNKYESAPAQVRQYQEAGLNPMLLAGNGAGVSASTAPQAATSAGVSPSGGDFVGVISGLLGAIANLRSSNAEVALKKATTEGLNIENRWKDRLLESQYNERLANIANIRANLPKILAETKHAEILAKYAPQLFESQVAGNVAGAQQALAYSDEARSKVRLNEAEIKELNAKTALHSKEMKEIDAKIMKIQQECITLGSQAYLNDQLVNESMARVDKYREQIRQIGTEIGLSEKELEHYEWNHAKDMSNNFFGFKIQRYTTYSDQPDVH